MTGFLAAVGVLLPFADPDLSYPLPAGADLRIGRPSQHGGPHRIGAVYSPDGTKLAVMTARTLTVRTVPDGRRLFEIPAGFSAASADGLVFSPCGQFLAFLTGAGGGQIVDPLSRAAVTFDGATPAASVPIRYTGEDGKEVVTDWVQSDFHGSFLRYVSRGVVRVLGFRNVAKDPGHEAVDFDPETGAVLSRRRLPDKPVALSRDGRVLLLEGRDGSHRRYDTTVWRYVGEPLPKPDHFGHLVGTDAECARLACCVRPPNVPERVILTDTRTGAEVRAAALPVPTTPAVEGRQIAIAPDFDRIESRYGPRIPGPGPADVTLLGGASPVEDHGPVAVYDRVTGARRGPPVRALRFGVSANGRWLVSADGLRVEVRDANTGGVVRSIAREAVPAGELAVSDDGNRVAYGAGGRFVVLDLTTGKPLAEGIERHVGHCRLTWDAKAILVGDYVGRPHLACWDIDTGRQRWRIDGQSPRPSADGEWAVHADSGRLRFLEMASGREVRSSPHIADHFHDGHPHGRVAVSADGRVIAVVTRGHVELFDADGALRRQVRVIPPLNEAREGPWSLRDIALSADGAWLAVGHYRSSGPLGSYLPVSAWVEVYETASGNSVMTVNPRLDAIAPLAFTPSGRHLWAVADYEALRFDLKPPRQPVFDRRNIVADLRGENAALADLARGRLAAPGMVAWLGEQLPPDRVPDAARVAEWIRQLADRDYATREEAMAALTARGPITAPALREVLKTSASPEARRRAEIVLRRVKGDPLPAPEMRLRRRAVAAVAWLAEDGDLAARNLLDAWATGDPGLPLTDAARAALARLPK